MNKFDRVLSDEEMAAVINNGCTSDLFSLAERVEQAVLTKLAKQDPVAWTSAEIMSGPSFVDDDDYAVMYKTKNHLLDDFCGYPEATPVPLYAHPMPCVSPTSDKPACDSQNEKYETQIPDGTFINEGTKHLERIKRYQKWRRGEDKTMDEADIQPKEIGESLDWLIGFTENHTEEARDMVPEEWRLINTHPNKQLKELLLFNKNKIQVGLLWGSEWVDVAYNRINPQPTHWLPLPNPPKEG